MPTETTPRLSRAARRWEQRLRRRAVELPADDAPNQLVVSVAGKPGELPQLLATAELVLAERGYELDRTEQPYDASHGVLVYALFVRPGEAEAQPTTGWL